MRIALLCATSRGRQVLERLISLAPEADLCVFSFREEEREPPFLDDIRGIAEGHGATFCEARRVGAKRCSRLWEESPPELLLAVSWRYMVPRSVYSRARLGAFVFHDSLLPTYRGFAPTVWAMVNGEGHTGATLFHMGEEVDAGDIVDQRRVVIGADETIAEVMERVTGAYLELLEEHLQGLMTGGAPRQAQDPTLATFCCRRTPTDNEIDWSASTARVYDLIRAVTRPYPGAYTYLQGAKLKIWRAVRVQPTPSYVGRVPGRVVEILPGEGVTVLTGDGCVCLREVELEGEGVAPAWEVVRRLSLTLGQ